MHTARPLRELQAALRAGALSVTDLVENALTTALWRRAQGSKVWLQLDPAAVRAQASGADVSAPLGGLPISVKDCFDTAGVRVSAGSSFYADTRPTPTQDSWYAGRARAQGAVLLGQTNLNEFAFGITGENAHFGNCRIPTQPDCLTGGSSSGAAASVVEGSAVIGLGTDTGGSLRAPASFCGLVSYRASHGVGDVRGCFPLAQSFDTLGFLLRHLADAPLAAEALLGIAPTDLSAPPRLGVTDGPWLEACDAETRANYEAFGRRLGDAGATVGRFDSTAWSEATSLFIPIQAHEAYANHRGYLDQYRDGYEPAVRARIEFGATISDEAYARYQERRTAFREAQNAALFESFDFLAVPITPVRHLPADQDHSGFRSRILTLTTPASVCGWPVLTVRGRGRGPEDPESLGCGIALIAPPGADARLLGLAHWLAERGF
ncbi:MAG: amidase [Verrucomicrobia bacterium]|nr:amidase [Verrucomicrobiota bacterium]